MSDDHEHSPDPLMVLLFSQNSFVGAAEKVENEIMPVDEQLSFTVGDAALVAQANTQLENDLVFARAINPEQHQETFPDWADREMNSYVLCEYFSAEDPEFSIGWFSRLKLIPIKAYRYKQARGWRKNGFPREWPDWIRDNFEKYTEVLAERSPDTVPRPTHCPNCQSTDVEIVVVQTNDFRGRVGSLTIDGHEFFIPVTEPKETTTHVARLQCNNCDSQATLADDEWRLPGLAAGLDAM